MKSILISIRPEWVEKIASREKTIEVRKNRPKLETPFKCLIYSTKASKGSEILLIDKNKQASFGDYRNADNVDWFDGNGKVIGEFTCDKITEFDYNYPFGYMYTNETYTGIRLTNKEIEEYGKGKTLYGWHISDLKIYDKPKELDEFYKPCYKSELCFACILPNINEEICNGRITRPPQSWCYVEEL